MECQKIVEIIEAYVFKHRLKNICVKSIISEAYINRNGVDLLNTCFNALREQERDNIYRDTEVSKFQTEKQCECCKEILPIQNFGITQVYRMNGEYFNSNCKSCAAEIASKWYFDMKNNEEKYKLYRKRMNKYKRDWRKKRKKQGLPVT